MNFFKNNVLALLLLIAGTAFAQPDEDHGNKKERIEVMRISFITQHLDLSPEEAQKFWPVYNEYRKALEAIIGESHAYRSKHPSREEVEDMSDKQVEQILEAEMAKHRRLLDLRQDYYKKFKTVLPIKKVAALYEAEKNFQRQLIHKLSDHRREKR